jgi:CLIP-associating protein 1/2
MKALERQPKPLSSGCSGKIRCRLSCLICRALLTALRSIANDRAKYDLQKGLQQHGISQNTVVQISTQLGVAIPAEIEPATSTKPQATSTARPPPVPSVTSQNISRTKPQILSATTSQSSTESKPAATSNKTPQATSTPHAQEVGPSKKIETSHKRVTSDSLPPVVITSVAEREAEKLDPAYVETARDLEDIFRDMQPHFEGKESEQNWSAREKSIIKLRKITKGNATGDLTTAYLVGIKGLLDGILKTINSLRTTVSTNGCHLIQDIARVAGSGLDNMVEILLPNLIKLCANTKKISASNGNITVDTILANVSYNIRLVQHIWNACQDKNVQPRTLATGWLKTIITKYGQRKSVLEHGGGLDLIEKCIKAGLTDRDKKVRESMRPTYWAFARICSEKSEQ